MTTPLRCVVDTSVCIKQFIADPLTPKVNQLFDHFGNPQTEVRVKTELIESRIDADLRDEFEKFAQSADETDINFSVLYAWWD